MISGRPEWLTVVLDIHIYWFVWANIVTVEDCVPLGIEMRLQNIEC